MIRPRSKPRTGRLKEADLQALRAACWLRDKEACQRCGVHVLYFAPHWYPNAFHMAHKRNKRMWGDTLENVQTECGSCHRQYHAQGPSMQKPCPPKEQSHEQ